MSCTSKISRATKIWPTIKNDKKRFVTKNFNFIGRTKSLKLTFLLLFCSLGFLVLNSCAQQVSEEEISIDQKIGQMINVGFRGLEAGPDSPIRNTIRNNYIGGVMLFDYDVPSDSALRNIQSPEQLQKLTSQLQTISDIPLLIAIDQEGGRVSRLKEKFGFPPSVSAEYLGKLDNIDSTRFYARRTARTLKEAGINVNLAPVVDLDTNPQNPVIGGLERSFSAEPQIVIKHARAFINELNKQGILTTLKHFPGHGSSQQDSHKGVTDVTETWQRDELIPYRYLIESGHADIIMTAHIYNAKIDSTHPATLSKPTITGILRDSLNFNGVIMSDDLQMGAIRDEYTLQETIRLAVQAGVDILAFANNSIFDPEIAAKAHRIIRKLVNDGTISEQRIDESYQRIMNLKQRLNSFDQ